MTYRICACVSRTFSTRIYPPKLGCGLCTEYYVLLTTEPATPVLYVVKCPVETVGAWDCYLASYCTRANAPTYYWCIDIFWLHEISGHHRFPEVGRPWHHWQITVNAAGDNQSAANAIENILLSHRWNLVRLIHELLFPNSWPKNLGVVYTHANMVTANWIEFCISNKILAFPLHCDRYSQLSFIYFIPSNSKEYSLWISWANVCVCLCASYLK
jgi:hypothetical protein